MLRTLSSISRYVIFGFTPLSLVSQHYHRFHTIVIGKKNAGSSLKALKQTHTKKKDQSCVPDKTLEGLHFQENGDLASATRFRR